MPAADRALAGAELRASSNPDPSELQRGIGHALLALHDLLESTIRPGPDGLPCIHLCISSPPAPDDAEAQP